MSYQAYKNCKGIGRIVDDVQVFGNEEKQIWQNCMKKQNTLEKEGIKHYFEKWWSGLYKYRHPEINNNWVYS